MLSPSTSSSSSSLSSLSHQSAVHPHTTHFLHNNAMAQQSQPTYNRSYPLTAQPVPPHASPYTYHTNLTSTFLPAAGSAPNAAPIQPYPPNGFQYTHSQLPPHQSSLPMLGKPGVMSGGMLGGGNFDPLMSPSDFYSTTGANAAAGQQNQLFNNNRQIHNTHAFHINHHYTHDVTAHKQESGVHPTAHGPNPAAFHVPHGSVTLPPPPPNHVYHAGVTHDNMHQNINNNNPTLMHPQKSSPRFDSLSTVTSSVPPPSELLSRATNNSTVAPNLPIVQTIPITHTVQHQHAHTHLVGGSGGANGKKGSACLVCYRAKTSCDGERPCFRCVRLHKTHLCYDRPKDERHPRRRKGSSARSRSRRNQMRKSAAAAAANNARVGKKSSSDDNSNNDAGNDVDANQNDDEEGEDGSEEGEGDEDEEADEDELDHSSTSPSVDTDRETSPSSSPETVELLKMSKRVTSAIDNKQISITQAQWYLKQVSDFLSGLEFDVLTRDLSFPIFISHTSSSASAFNFNSNVPSTTQTDTSAPPPLESPISTNAKSAATDAELDSNAAVETAAEKSISSSLLALSTASRASSDAITAERRILFSAQYDSSPLLCMEEDKVSLLAQQRNQQASAHLSQAASSIGGIVTPIEDSVPMMIIAAVQNSSSTGSGENKQSDESAEVKSNAPPTSTAEVNPRKRPAATEPTVDSKRIKLEGNESAPVKSSVTVEVAPVVENAPLPVRSLCVQVNREWERLFGFTQKEVRQLLLKDGNGFFSRLFRADAKDHAVKAVLGDDADRSTKPAATSNNPSAAASTDVEMVSDKEPNLKFLAVIVNKWLAEIHCLVQARPHSPLSSTEVTPSNPLSVFESLEALPGCVLTWQPLPDPRPPKIKAKHKRAKSHS